MEKVYPVFFLNNSSKDGFKKLSASKINEVFLSHDIKMQILDIYLEKSPKSRVACRDSGYAVYESKKNFHKAQILFVNICKSIGVFEKFQKKTTMFKYDQPYKEVSLVYCPKEVDYGFSQSWMNFVNKNNQKTLNR